ncbi:STAS domain-containing protein [Aliidiomarina maris]|uniref:Anti-sigma B factor antagonist n=1 Tax=Aliidiomarina maris TaxID=531312 RepID=A0A327X3P4_9GAMM|nr:STAS domain-containing protein [Aliidiomarina maris]MBA3987608.1 anti-sigma B factor antagonist [Idiomarina sp.]MCL5051397.1 STAS domain-containing protein [Bacillota bacterium]RAJ99262.1 phospholipid transport system transporter-binding protein [Aliidiomarina maris]RUO27595.1 anti-sigma B factor antagonist [Aliidiomarina maris]
MPQALQFNAQNGEVVVHGDLDRNTVPKAWAERQQWLPQQTDVVINLEAVSHVDSAGLAMLIRLRSELVANQQTLTLRNLNKQLQQFAQVSGVEGLVSIS